MVDQGRDWLPQARRAVFEVYRRQAASAWIEAHGESMRPLIGPGTWMFVEFGTTPAHLGEIVLFALNEIIVTHRVVARRCQQDTVLLITKGDAEPYPDPPLRLVDVIGVVRALRYGTEGRTVSIGCTGRSARVVAQISHCSSRSAFLIRRAAVLPPGPFRRVALRAIPSYTRVAARVLLAPLAWAAWIQTVQLHILEKR